HGFETVDVVNRTEENARELAAITGGRAYGWHELHTALADSDIVITATGAPHTVIHEPDVEMAMRARHGRELVLIDTAVPRDVGDGVETVPGVHFYNIDDLQKVVDANYARRRDCIPLVEAIVCDENEKFTSWLRSREVVPAIRGLREKVQSIAEAELAATLAQLPDEDHEAVSTLVHRIVNKVLHEPTVRLREQAVQESGEVYIHALRDLFALDAEEVHG
ncbi:MAG: glutamyl-tRNA reductase, partial [Chloroflexota bacterium]